MEEEKDQEEHEEIYLKKYVAILGKEKQAIGDCGGRCGWPTPRRRPYKKLIESLRYINKKRTYMYYVRIKAFLIYMYTLIHNKSHNSVTFKYSSYHNVNFPKVKNKRKICPALTAKGG